MFLLVQSFWPHLTMPRAVSSVFTPLYLPAGIASVVAILDEMHQAYIPGRDASVTDVLLDMAGITLIGILFHSFQQRKKKNGRKYTERN